MLDRRKRRFVRQLLGAVAAVAAAPGTARSALPRIVVIGGGAGGATAARLLAADTALRAHVTLVEAKRDYYASFFANHVIGGFRTLASIKFGYAGLAKLERLTVVHALAERVDRQARMVMLESGEQLPYDRLILSPGVSLDYGNVPGYGFDTVERAPHAWTSGQDAATILAQARAMPPGGTFVVVPPPDPSRCPPGPYERVSMLAHLFSQINPTAKIIILDSKERFAKQTLFQSAWETYYPDMVLWLPPSISGGILHFDAKSMAFETDLETFTAHAASIVPAQRAGSIAIEAALTDASGWVPVHLESFASIQDPHIFVIGDAAVTASLPKSAFSAQQHAQIAVAGVRQSLDATHPLEAGPLANVCWSLVAPRDSVKIGATYRRRGVKMVAEEPFISSVDDDADARAANAREANAWFDVATRTMFGAP